MGRPWASGDHVHVFYNTEEEHRQALSAQFVAALEHGDKIAYVADGDGTAPEVQDWIAAVGPGAEEVLARGQGVVWPASEYCLTDDAFDSDRVMDVLATETSAAEDAGFSGLRVCVNMDVPLGHSEDITVVLDHERRLDTTFAEERLPGLTLVCQYNERGLPAAAREVLRKLCVVSLTAEQAQQREPALRTAPLPGKPGLRLAGEIDESNRAEFAAVLESVCRAGHPCHLDLADLRYADVAAVKLIVRAATGVSSGVRLILHSPAPIIRTILRIYGWDRLPALRLMEGTDS